MMIKPANYDNVKAIRNGFERLPAGGYVCKIIDAKDTISKNGKPMIVLLLDISNGKYKDYFREQYDRDKQYNVEAAKWRGCYYQLYDDNNLSRFKGMIEIIQDCNNGYVFDWNEKSLKYKAVGAVFREREYLNSQGNTRTAVECWQLRELDGIEKIEPPPKKELEQKPYSNQFGTEAYDEQVPF